MELRERDGRGRPVPVSLLLDDRRPQPFPRGRFEEQEQKRQKATERLRQEQLDKEKAALEEQLRKLLDGATQQPAARQPHSYLASAPQSR